MYMMLKPNITSWNLTERMADRRPAARPAATAITAHLYLPNDNIPVHSSRDTAVPVADTRIVLPMVPPRLW